jgi:hypothetical protein
VLKGLGSESAITIFIFIIIIIIKNYLFIIIENNQKIVNSTKKTHPSTKKSINLVKTFALKNKNSCKA